MKSLKPIAVVSAVLLSPLALPTAWASGDYKGGHDVQASKPATANTAVDTASMSDAEVRKIDKDTKKITLKHGELKNLEMPAMTMVFQVKDVALLDKVKVGDKVKFRAEKTSAGYGVSEIEVVK